ncbi:hypothetical protein CRI85_05830 [Leuconostoc pseudomesenteroides]|uniref:hypothetical protein n=1 Tax=Leuconostoc pseudomesenteroides TaxID=33968 RepID=UPI001E34F904|nr:hypothetical protein [Leuconostoc pseudomesenteroides]MCC8439852.1 hypothetical protein [Leuconostoc pseudomesenteroides]
MIEKDNIFKIRVPYPNIESKLVQKRHRYIVRDSVPHVLTCQSYKPFLLTLINNYVIIDPDPLVAPQFNNKTIVDLDKMFEFNLISNLENYLLSPAKISKIIADRIDGKIDETKMEIIQIAWESMLVANPDKKLTI